MGKKKEDNAFDRQKQWLSDTLKGKGETGIDYQRLYQLGTDEGIFSGSDSMELPRLLHGNREVSRRETPRVNGKSQKQLFHIDFGPKDAVPYSKKPARKAVETPSKRVRSIKRDYPDEPHRKDRVSVQPFARNIPAEKRQEAVRVIRRTLEDNPGKWYSLKDLAEILQAQGFLEPNQLLGHGDHGDLKRHQRYEEKGLPGAKMYRLPAKSVQPKLNNILDLERARLYVREFLKASGKLRSWEEIERALVMDGLISKAPLSKADKGKLVKDNGVVVHANGLSFDLRYWIARRLEELGDGVGMMPDFDGEIFPEEGLIRSESVFSPEIITAREVDGERTLFEVVEGESVAHIDNEGKKREQHWPLGPGKIVFIPLSLVLIVLLFVHLF
jgi:hypothetical protein